jgi:hypothetical protein
MRINIVNRVNIREIACKLQHPDVGYEIYATGITAVVLWVGLMFATMCYRVVIVDFVECLYEWNCSLPETLYTCQRVFASAFTIQDPLSFSEHSFPHVLRDGIGIILPKLHGVFFSRINVRED